jgi:hypothetical protein
VHALLQVFEGQSHAQFLAALVPETGEAFGEIARFLRRPSGDLELDRLRSKRLAWIMERESSSQLSRTTNAATVRGT